MVFGFAACRSVDDLRAPRFDATPWPAADRLFHQDPRWLGADSAYSVALGSRRTLWLFGDTFVATAPGGARSGSRMIRNSIGVQIGDDPSKSAMTFYWRGEGGEPRSFFEAGASDEWLWPGHGVEMGGALVLFFLRMRPSGREGMWNFESVGNTAFLVENPHEQPPAWRVRRLAIPDNAFGVSLSGGALVDGPYLHVYGVSEPDHRVCVARWPLVDAERGDLSGAAWWCGSSRGWVSQRSIDGAPEPILRGSQTEFTVHRDRERGLFVMTHTEGFGAAVIEQCFANRPEGPWSESVVVYRPEETAVKDVMIYAAKAHPQLRGADLVLTYATNSFDFGAMVSSPTLYYPRFVRLMREP
ncbi:MAG: DUF4185 domain-containing protein [Planctomycetes bacterium]|nr:DUF4185 domain-containing protein [Planctomycetota bacterium]MBI3847072.1 DUF4185 domain-containing protein [Planctomycetota bacterium]